MIGTAAVWDKYIHTKTYKGIYIHKIIATQETVQRKH